MALGFGIEMNLICRRTNKITSQNKKPLVCLRIDIGTYNEGRSERKAGAFQLFRKEILLKIVENYLLK